MIDPAADGPAAEGLGADTASPGASAAPASPAGVPEDFRKRLRRAFPAFTDFTCPEQGAIARAFWAGKPLDVLGLLPTGKGKSLTFLLPARLWSKEHDGRGLVVVVSPILALMQDQVDAVGRLERSYPGARLLARQLNSAVSPEEKREVRREVRLGRVNLLYLGPETLVQPWTYEMLADAASNRILRGLVVDEAHMIAEWGDEFRTAFKRMGPVRRLLREACPQDEPLRTLLLTATLPPEGRGAILRSVGCSPDTTAVIEHRSIRGEHRLVVRHAHDHDEKLGLLREDVGRLRPSGSGIIYCAMRTHCEEIAASLEATGLGPAVHFHGGTAPDRRRELLREFRASDRLVIAATDAFGLGVDKPDVRWVVHFSMPNSLDAYYQEIGRAGRDGKACEAVLYYCPADKGHAKRNAHKVLTPEKFESRFRALREGAVTVQVSDAPEPFKLVEETELPDYVEDPAKARASKASLRTHAEWNYAVLVRADEQGLIELGPEVLFEVRCRLSERATIGDARKRAPKAAAAGMLDALAGGRVVTLSLGRAAARASVPPRALQQEIFDLLGEGVLFLPDDPDDRLWDTRILVVDRAGGTTRRREEDTRRRWERQAKSSRRVDEMANYARSVECRRFHFFRTYGYSDLAPPGGCGRCDVCCGG
ncbi:MAG: ATP-dependent DNA helicase RecQ [Planctomycetes bacterium]|nr:ATP-dependent DNA helicase RecQ [Planctomycetota bacterium]